MIRSRKNSIFLSKFFKSWYSILFLILFLLSIFAILGALFVEYILKIPPCHLCLMQRAVYYLIISFSFIGIIFSIYSHKISKIINLIIIIVIFLYFAQFCVAGYNVLVEKHLIPDIFTTKCASNKHKNIKDKYEKITNADIENELNSMMNRDFIPCDKPGLVFIGISLAGWNAIYSIFIFIFSIFFVKKFKKNKSF